MICAQFDWWHVRTNFTSSIIPLARHWLDDLIRFSFSHSKICLFIFWLKKLAKLNLKSRSFEAGRNTPRGQEKMCFWRSLVQTFAIVSKSVETLRHVILWLSLLRGFSSRFRLLEFYSYIENSRLLLIRSFLPSKIVLRVT